MSRVKSVLTHKIGRDPLLDLYNSTKNMTDLLFLGLSLFHVRKRRILRQIGIFE